MWYVWYINTHSFIHSFKLVEARWFCFHINLHAFTCTVILKTLTALQSTIHDCLNQKLIPYSMKWGFPDKMLFSFTWLAFSSPYKAPASWLLFKELFMTVWIHVKHWSQSPWNEVSQIKYDFPLPDGYFLLHIRLLPQHLQDFILQFFYSICFSFFLA